MAFVIAFVLVLLSGAFYLAGHVPSSGLSMLCDYGSSFCEHPRWTLYAAGAFLLWGLLQRVDRL